MNECKRCGACCRFLLVPIGTVPITSPFMDYIRFLTMHGLAIEADKRFVWMRLDVSCRFLKDNLCSIYESRPLVCRKYNGPADDLAIGKHPCGMRE